MLGGFGYMAPGFLVWICGCCLRKFSMCYSVVVLESRFWMCGGSVDVWWLRKSPPPLKLQNRQCSRRGSHGIRLPHLPRRIATHGASRALLRRRERRPRIDILSDILTHNYRFELEIKCTSRRRHTPGPCTYAITDTWASTVLPLYIHIQHPRSVSYTHLTLPTICSV